MKVCIIGDSNIGFMPYLKYYEEILISLRIQYTILYWDRFNLNEKKENTFRFGYQENRSLISRISGYIKYRKFILKHLENHGYDFYIVLSAQIGLLINNFLKTHPFILDIRDYTHENIFIYRSLAFDLIKRASLVGISSPAFKQWLPEGAEYVISHNMEINDVEKQTTDFDFNKRIITFAGFIRYYLSNIAFLKTLKGRPDIAVKYAGGHQTNEENKIKRYCFENNMTNVEFSGVYTERTKPDIYRSTNFIHSYYGNSNISVTTQIPNRLYESCIYKRPIIVSSGTYLAEIVTRHEIGIVFDTNNPEQFFQDMNRYYDPDYYERYKINCNRFLETVVKDIRIFRSKVKEVLAANKII